MTFAKIKILTEKIKKIFFVFRFVSESEPPKKEFLKWRNEKKTFGTALLSLFEIDKNAQTIIGSHY